MKILKTEIKRSIRAVPDFPKKGILFRDITPLLLDKKKFKRVIDYFVSVCPKKIDYVISVESRGFIFGSAFAYAAKAGFVPIRKEGKLPFQKFQKSYDLEYGSAIIEIHADAMKKGARIVIIDDVLATGGTVEAAIGLVRKFNAEILGIYFLIELLALEGRRRLSDYPVHSLVTY